MSNNGGQNSGAGKIVLPGGSGYLGEFLAEHFRKRGHDVTVLSRKAQPEQTGVRFVEWDGESVGEWAREFEGALAVVNLAGRTVNCRYVPSNKKEIYDSRLKSTKAVGEAIARCEKPPRVWVNSSSATIYRDAYDRPMDEETGEIGSGFSVDVCEKWEAVMNEIETPQTRKVALRSAMVFGPGKDGVMDAFLKIARYGLGGSLGTGKQYVSWIHVADFLAAVQWILDHEELSGPINLASPYPLPNADFMKIVRDAAHRPAGLPAAKWMLEIGAFVLGTETELLLKSRRVIPTRLLQSGFTFHFPLVQDAVRNILEQ